MKKFLKPFIGIMVAIFVTFSCTKEQLDQLSEINEINKNLKIDPLNPNLNINRPKKPNSPNPPSVIVINPTTPSTPQPKPQTEIVLRIENEKTLIERLYVNGERATNLVNYYTIIINKEDLGKTANYNFYDECNNSFEGTFTLDKESRIRLNKKLYEGILNFQNTSSNPYFLTIDGEVYEIPGKSARHLKVNGYNKTYFVSWKQKSGYLITPTTGRREVRLSCENKETFISFP